MKPDPVSPGVDNPQVRSTPSPPAAWLFLLAGGLIATALAQFFIDSLADGSDLWHWIQHGLLFAGGLGVGIALLQLYRSATR